MIAIALQAPAEKSAPDFVVILFAISGLQTELAARRSRLILGMFYPYGADLKVNRLYVDCSF
jgi:hypothetical protein